MHDHFSNAERAEVLTAALPYIKKYSGKIVVIKYGGNAMINEQLKQQVMEDIALLWLIGVKVVLVHCRDCWSRRIDFPAACDRTYRKS